MSNFTARDRSLDSIATRLTATGQPIALELDLLVVALRDHALVGGELALVDARDEQAIADVEELVVLAELVRDRRRRRRDSSRDNSVSVFFGMIALNSAPTASLAAALVTSARRCPSVATMIIVLALDDELRAIQVVARVLTGDRKLRAARSARARPCAATAHRSATGRFRQRREILARQRLHPRLETIGRHLHVRAVLFDPHIGVGQRLHDLEQLLRRQRQRSTARDRRLAACCAD